MADGLSTEIVSLRINNQSIIDVMVNSMTKICITKCPIFSALYQVPLQKEILSGKYIRCEKLLNSSPVLVEISSLRFM